MKFLRTVGNVLRLSVNNKASLYMSSYQPPIFQPIGCMSSSKPFNWGLSSGTSKSRGKGSPCLDYEIGSWKYGNSIRRYRTGNRYSGSNDRSNNAAGARAGYDRSNSGHDRNGVGKLRNNRTGGRRGSGKGGYGDGFRMPEFNLGPDHLTKIFESQLETSDPTDGLNMEKIGPVEGNFRDDDDPEIENFHRAD